MPGALVQTRETTRQFRVLRIFTKSYYRSDAKYFASAFNSDVNRLAGCALLPMTFSRAQSAQATVWPPAFHRAETRRNRKSFKWVRPFWAVAIGSELASPRPLRSTKPIAACLDLLLAAQAILSKA